MSVQQPTVGDTVQAEFLGRTTAGELEDIRYEPTIASTSPKFVINTDTGKVVVTREQLQ